MNRNALITAQRTRRPQLPAGWGSSFAVSPFTPRVKPRVVVEPLPPNAPLSDRLLELLRDMADRDEPLTTLTDLGVWLDVPREAASDYIARALKALHNRGEVTTWRKPGTLDNAPQWRIALIACGRELRSAGLEPQGMMG